MAACCMTSTAACYFRINPLRTIGMTSGASTNLAFLHFWQYRKFWMLLTPKPTTRVQCRRTSNGCFLHDFHSCLVCKSDAALLPKCADAGRSLQRLAESAVDRGASDAAQPADFPAGVPVVPLQAACSLAFRPPHGIVIMGWGVGIRA